MNNIKKQLSKQQITNLTKILNKILKSQSEKTNEFNSIHSGNLGRIMLLSTANVFFNDNRYNTEIGVLLNKVLTEYNTQDNTYISGKLGIDFAIAYLVKLKIIDFKDFDVHFKNRLSSYKNALIEIESNNYDFFTGYLGLFPFLMEAKKYYKEETDLLFEAIFSKLSLSAIQLNEGLVWNDAKAAKVYNIDNNTKIETRVNLGMAHGMPSIIAAAAIAKAKNHKVLFDKAVISMKSFSRNDCISVFPSFDLNKDNKASSRLGYCYGDLAVAYSLLTYSKTFKNSNLEEYAKGVILKTFERDKTNSALNEGCLCHGYSSAIYYYFIINQTVEIDGLSKAFLYWIDILIAEYSNKRFFYRKEEDKVIYGECDGLFDGEIGIALVIMSLLSEKKLSWDRCLLLS
jgi:hypothetical protein